MRTGSRLYEVTTQVFRRMVEDSVDGVWQGSLTGLISEFKGRNYYSDVKQAIIRSGGAVQLHRGGGPTPSQWQITDPDANFEEVKVSARGGMEGRLDDIERLLGGIDIRQALQSLGTDVQSLKLDVTRLKEAEAKRDA